MTDLDYIWNGTTLELRDDAGNNVIEVDLETLATAAAINNAGGDYNEGVETHATASGTVTVDLSDGNAHVIEAVDNITINITGTTATPPGNNLTILVEDDDGGGPYTVDYDDGLTILWGDGDEFNEIAANDTARVGFTSFDGGTEWQASYVDGFAVV